MRENIEGVIYIIHHLCQIHRISYDMNQEVNERHNLYCP